MLTPAVRYVKPLYGRARLAQLLTYTGRQPLWSNAPIKPGSQFRLRAEAVDESRGVEIDQPLVKYVVNVHPVGQG